MPGTAEWGSEPPGEGACERVFVVDVVPVALELGEFLGISRRPAFAEVYANAYISPAARGPRPAGKPWPATPRHRKA